MSATHMSRPTGSPGIGPAREPHGRGSESGPDGKMGRLGQGNGWARNGGVWHEKVSFPFYIILISIFIFYFHLNFIWKFLYSHRIQI
jgi:hypothetical protein